jgi:hypothetical protein
VTAPAPEPSRRALTGRSAWLLAGLVALVAGLCLHPMAETDLFFRLAVGEQILQSGAIPRRNLFSFTHPDHPDLDPAWLFDVAVALLHRAGGFTAVVVAKTALVLAIFTAAFAVCRRRGAGPIAATLTLAVAALVMRERLVERPHLFSLAGELAVLALALLPALPSARRLLALTALTALWANLHAGAFLAPALLGAGAAGALFDRPFSRRAVMSLVAAAAAGAAALLLTPVGPGIFRYLAAHVGLFAVHPVDEFRVASWTSDAPWLAFAAAGALLVALTARRAPPRPPWREVLPVAALAALATLSVRFVPEATLLAAPLVATSASALAATFRVPAPRPLPLAVGAALALAALVPRAAQPRFVALGLDRSSLPLEAIRFAEANGLRARMYNDFEVGSYLAWEGFPRHRVFVDPRLPAYPRSFHAQLGRSDWSRAGWDAVLAAHGVESALLTHAGINHRIGWWDPARWALVHRAHDARLFVRRLERWRALIAAHEIPATFSFAPATGAATIPLETAPPGSPVPACEWDRRLGDLLFELDGGRPNRALAAYRRALAAPSGCLARAEEARAAAWVGAVELQHGVAAAALAALERARAAGAEDLPTLTNQALALEALGRRRQATAAWQEIARRAAGTPLGARARQRAGQ